MNIKRTPVKLLPDNCVLELQNGLYALLDPNDHDRLKKYKWLIKDFKRHPYAYRKKIVRDKETKIYMHRQIAHAPNHLIVHHKNLNTLDNRKSNLELMPLKSHQEIHRFL